MQRVARIAGAVTSAAGAVGGALGALAAAPGVAGAAGTSGAPGDDVVSYVCGSTTYACPTGWIMGVTADETTGQWKGWAVNDSSAAQTGQLDLLNGNADLTSIETLPAGGAIETSWEAYYTPADNGVAARCDAASSTDIIFKLGAGGWWTTFPLPAGVGVPSPTPATCLPFPAS